MNKKFFTFLIVFTMILFCGCNRIQKMDTLIDDFEQNVEKLENLTDKILQGNYNEEEVFEEYLSIEENVNLILEKIDKINEDDISMSQWNKLYSLADRLEKLSYYYYF